MKLSKAILKGADVTKQTKFDLYRNDPDTGEIAFTCALGSAVVGKKGLTSQGNLCYGSEEFESEFPILGKRLSDYPINYVPVELREHIHWDLRDAIVHLNDIHGWSRKAIALWVSTLEDYDESLEEISKEENTQALKQLTH